MTRLFNFLFGDWKQGHLDATSKIAYHPYVRRLQARLVNPRSWSSKLPRNQVILQQELDYAKSMNLADIKRSLKYPSIATPWTHAEQEGQPSGTSKQQPVSGPMTPTSEASLYEVQVQEGIAILESPDINAKRVGYLSRGSQFVAKYAFLALEPRGWITLGGPEAMLKGIISVLWLWLVLCSGCIHEACQWYKG